MDKSLAASKPHYVILDGLRGVAAVVVVIFHIFEAHSMGDAQHQIINHGYLAVDFFFLLSGYVIGYAYDDRWNKMSIGDFFKRRLIRLQPMVILGSIIGAACFYFQGSPELFPLIGTKSVWQTLVIMLIGFTMIPVPTSMDIRGWQEMYPLNGPAWSLFFEYIANILYAVIVRKFSKTLLAILVFVSACLLVQYTVHAGDLIGGWAIDPLQLRIGFTRVLYPFFAGLLLYRTAKLTSIKNAFLWCSLLLVIVLSVPRLGGTGHVWINGLYESLTIILVFPLIVYFGASGSVSGKWPVRICKFFGDISYPIYITHYPIIYIYTAWVFNHKYTIQQALPQAIIVLVSSVTLAYACLKLYDEPVRNWLKKMFLTKDKSESR